MNDTPVGTRIQCAQLKNGVQPFKKREGMVPAVYEPGDLEHPAVPNLFLSLEQRRYGASLEIIDPVDEKRFRILWKTPIAVTQTRTSHQFTKMDMSLFK